MNMTTKQQLLSILDWGMYIASLSVTEFYNAMYYNEGLYLR